MQSSTKPVIGLSKKRITNREKNKNNNNNNIMHYNNKSTIINSKHQNQPKTNEAGVVVSSSFRRRARRRHHHHQQQQQQKNTNNIVIISFSNLIIDNDILRNIIFSFCDLISFVQLCGTCKRIYYSFHINNNDQWDRYESMIPKSSRWCYNDDDDDDDDNDDHDDHCEVTTETSTTTTTTIRGNVGRPKQRSKIINAKTKMRVIRYVRASRFASKLQPLVPYHSTTISTTTTDHFNNTFNAVGCFNERTYSSYGYFVRLFPLRHCVSDFSSSVLTATKEKFMKFDNPLLLSSPPQNQDDDDNDEILWQGFLNVSKFTEWQHNGKTIEIQTQPEFDLMKDVPSLISEHTRLRRWSPLTNLANNVGIIVIAIQKPMMTTDPRDRMSLVYASTQTAPTCMVFSKMNFELSNTYVHHRRRHRHATDRSSSSEEESSPPQTPTPVVATAPRTTTSGFAGTTTTMRRVSMIANRGTTKMTTTLRSGGDSNNNQISLTFKLDEGDANRIGFIGNPYLADLHNIEDGKNDGNDDNDDEKRKKEQKPVREPPPPPPPPPIEQRSDLLSRRRLRIPPRKVVDLRKEEPIVGGNDGRCYWNKE